MRVVFRIEQEFGGALAFLPDEPHQPGGVVCYVGKGRRQEVALSFYKSTRAPSSDIDRKRVAALKHQLEERGYQLEECDALLK